MSYNTEPWIHKGGHIVVAQNIEGGVPGTNDDDSVKYYGGHLVAESMTHDNAARACICVNNFRGIERPDLLGPLLPLLARCAEAARYSDPALAAELAPFRGAKDPWDK